VALGRAAGIDLGPPPDTRWRPRRGVGGEGARGGVDVGSFLAEDAARSRVDKGQVAPALRDVERRMDRVFDPPFAHVDVGNKRELLHKQFMGRLGKPPKIKPLARGVDPARETQHDKEEAIVAEPFFLGRRVEVFARQRADGSIVELALRQPSGFRAFDEEALDAVEHALRGRVPSPDELHHGESRTLWQLEATAYVVYSPYPSAIFDESTGKVEWIYPLEKRVDHNVKLVAAY
jgi:hypothetical protein